MEAIPSSVLRYTALVLSICLLSSSCARDDWIVTLTCDGGFSSLTPVTTELFVNGKRASRTAYINPAKLSLGDIVQIGTGSGSGYPEIGWHMPIQSADEISPVSVRLRSISISDGFQVKFDQDIKTAADLVGVDLERVVLKNTDLHILGPVVRNLRDPTGFIERNPEIIKRIRTTTGARFVVVSGAITGQYILLKPAWKSLSAVDTFYFGDTYVHVTYSCPAFAPYSERLSAEGRSPVIYITPVRYDEATSMVVADPRSLLVVRHN